MNRNARRRIARAVGAAAAVSAVAMPMALTPSEQAGASNYAQMHIIWGLFGGGPYSCQTEIGHEVAYGGSLAYTWTPDPSGPYPDNSCWSTYTDQITAQGNGQASPGGNPSSSVLYANNTPNQSWHTVCYGLYDCDSELVLPPVTLQQRVRVGSAENRQSPGVKPPGIASIHGSPITV